MPSPTRTSATFTPSSPARPTTRRCNSIRQFHGTGNKLSLIRDLISTGNARPAGKPTTVAKPVEPPKATPTEPVKVAAAEPAKPASTPAATVAPVAAAAVAAKPIDKPATEPAKPAGDTAAAEGEISSAVQA